MERLTFSDAGPADWPYLLCLWWRNVRATHGFVAEDYLRAIGAALPGAYLPAMERVWPGWRSRPLKATGATMRRGQEKAISRRAR